MRAALITLPMPGEGDQPSIAGKSLAERQLLFARELGCETVIAYGGGASGDAIALRHAAESAKLRFQVISNAHALAGIIGSGDSLLVVQQGLLPEASQALDLLRAEGDRMLVVSAGPGVAAGFERIDLDRAWAGVMTLPGSWLEHLTALPEDVAPDGALLRICLQKKLPEARVSDAILDDARWTIIANDSTAEKHESRWLAEHLGETEMASPSRWLGSQLVARAGSKLLRRKWSSLILGGLPLALLGGAIATIWYDVPWAAFGLVALSVPLLEGFLALTKVASAPFGERAKTHLTRWLVDLTLLTVSALAIDSLWYRAAFPALTLVAALVLLDRRIGRKWEYTLRDRGVAAVSLAIFAGVASPEIAVLALATVLVGTLLSPEPKPRA